MSRSNGKKSDPYSYIRFDGVRCDLTPMLEYHSKEEVAGTAARQGRKHALQAALDAFRNAGELDILQEVLGMNGIASAKMITEVDR